MHCRNCRGLSIQDDGVKTEAQKLLETTRKNYGRLDEHLKYLYNGVGIAGSSEWVRGKESRLKRAARLAHEEGEEGRKRTSFCDLVVVFVFSVVVVVLFLYAKN
jgi:hypothetical protein